MSDTHSWKTQTDIGQYNQDQVLHLKEHGVSTLVKFEHGVSTLVKFERELRLRKLFLKNFCCC